MLYQEILVFRLSETASCAFSGTVSLVFIKRFWKNSFLLVLLRQGLRS